MSRPRSGDQPPQTWSFVAGHSRLDEVLEHEPGASQGPHDAAERPVVLDVRRPSGRVALDVRRSSQYDVLAVSPRCARVVGEAPSDGMRHAEDPPTARSQDARDLAVQRLGVRHEGHRAVGREGDVEAVGSGTAGARASAWATAGRTPGLHRARRRAGAGAAETSTPDDSAPWSDSPSAIPAQRRSRSRALAGPQPVRAARLPPRVRPPGPTPGRRPRAKPPCSAW